jgi:hypothetical protein
MEPVAPETRLALRDAAAHIIKAVKTRPQQRFVACRKRLKLVVQWTRKQQTQRGRSGMALYAFIIPPMPCSLLRAL